MARCDTNSYWLAGMKVRSGESSVLIAGEWVRVVCDKPEAGELNVRDVPHGLPVRVTDVGVFSFDAARWRGRKGARIDMDAALSTVALEVRPAYLKRLMESHPGGAAVPAVMKGFWMAERAATCYLKRCPEAVWGEVLRRAALGEAEWGRDFVVHVLETIENTTLLSKIAKYEVAWYFEPALKRLLQMGDLERAADLIGEVLTECDVVSVRAAVAILEDGEGRAHLETLLKAGVSAGRVADAVRAALAIDEADQLKRFKEVLLIEHRERFLDLLQFLERGAFEDAGSDQAVSSFTTPLAGRIVGSQERDLLIAVWQETVDALQENGMSLGDGVHGWRKWMEVGADAGLPVSVWSQAPFGSRERIRIAGVLTHDQLRAVLPESWGATRLHVLRRLNDESLWLHEALELRSTQALERMPTAVLAKVLHADPSWEIARAVAVGRGVLGASEALHDVSRKVRMAGLMKTRDQQVLTRVIEEEDLSMVFVAGRRSIDTAALDTAVRRFTEVSPQSKMLRQVKARREEVLRWEAAEQAVARGEVVVARALLAELSMFDLVERLARHAELAPWAGQRLHEVQKALN
jgi:hypothetical protein